MTKELLCYIVGVIIPVIILIYCVIEKEFLKEKMKTKDKEVAPFTPKHQMSIPLYVDLLSMFREINQLVASMREIIDLTNKNADVQYTVLKDMDISKEYLSDKPLCFWLKSYYNQLDLYITMLVLVFENVRPLLKQEYANIFYVNLEEVKVFRDNVKSIVK